MHSRSVRLAIVLAAIAALSASGRPGSAQERASAPAADGARQARSAKIASAAQAFLATLTPDERKAMVYSFDDAAERTHWSNFPDGHVTRGGVRWGELTAPQQAAFMQLLATLLSPQGLTMVREQMDADDTLQVPHGPDGKLAPIHYGRAYYHVSFLGTPSTATPWMLQFGGHHLAINATLVGARVTLSPTLTGGEPLKYAKDGKRIYIVEDEVKTAAALLGGLTPDQKRMAVVSPERIDLVLGPGHDGQALQPEGLPGRDMTEAQRTQMLALIAARVGILNPDHAAPLLAAARRDLDRTWFAWWGPTDKLGGAYFRLTAPTLIIEYAPQDTDGDETDHAHNMYRDPTNDYGSAWRATS
jgi:Spy/CpxP family protein refolding chaperone